MIYTIIEIAYKTNLFQYNSKELNELVTKYQNFINNDLLTPESQSAFQFCLSSLISGQIVTDYSTLPDISDPDWLHYLLSTGLASFKSTKNKNQAILLIFRNIYGIYTYSISEPYQNSDFRSLSQINEISNDTNTIINDNNNIYTMDNISSNTSSKTKKNCCVISIFYNCTYYFWLLP